MIFFINIIKPMMTKKKKNVLLNCKILFTVFHERSFVFVHVKKTQYDQRGIEFSTLLLRSLIIKSYYYCIYVYMRAVRHIMPSD